MKKVLTLLVSFLAVFALSAELSPYDLNAPFGWATCTSLTSGDDYALTGGGSGKSITLTSNGEDMASTIYNMLQTYDVIVLDGSQGDFIFSKAIDVKVSNKTIVGINNARLCTKFQVTPEIRQLMDDNGVKKNSSGSGSGGTLSNGIKVNEARETKTRQLLIDYTGDSSESYRLSGIFSIKACSNLIIRNLDFVGPGAIDVGGSDMISIHHSAHHVWVDHCSFTDGMDGNVDITVKADFVTVSWCVFKYTDRSYDHCLTNLVAGSEDAATQGEDNLNVTFANNRWGEGCENRMPMVRFGTIHLLNNYYDCANCGMAISPRKQSEFLIEANYFEKGVKKIFSAHNEKAYEFWGNEYSESFVQPENKASVHIPYQYKVYDAKKVPAVVSSAHNGAGPTLSDPLTIGRSDDVFPEHYRLVYQVDDEIYKVTYVAAGDSLRLIDAPAERKGYSFGGWTLSQGEIPAIMPQSEVIVYGYFYPNTYALRYHLMNELYAVDSLQYKDQIQLREAPQKEGYVFSGWDLYSQAVEEEFKALEGQIKPASMGIVSSGTVLAAGDILAENEAVSMSVGADDTYKPSSARANDIQTASVGAATLDLSKACQGATNPKDALGNECNVSGQPPAKGAFLSFELKDNGYLFVFHKASSNKIYMVTEETSLLAYDFAMYSPGAPWGDFLSYRMEGDDGVYINDLTKLQWPEKIVLGDAWEQHAGEAAKVGINGVAVIKFPVRKGFHYTVNACGSKLTCAGFVFANADHEVLMADAADNKLLLMPVSESFGGSLPLHMPAHDLDVYGSFALSLASLPLDEKFNVYNLQGLLLYQDLSREELRAKLPAGLYLLEANQRVLKCFIK